VPASRSRRAAAPVAAPPAAPAAAPPAHPPTPLTPPSLPPPPQVQAQVEELLARARAGDRQAALDGLLALEKAGRLAEDVPSTRAACLGVLEALHGAGDWAGLREHAALLAKRRGQLREVVRAVVRRCAELADGAPDPAERVAMLTALAALTEGRIYVEIERARVTRSLAALREAAGDVAGAAELLQEVAVETFGGMHKAEKIAFILEQVRLCLDRGDAVRAQILARKVSPRAFAPAAAGRRGEGAGEVGIEGTAIEAPAEGTPPLPELRLRYYALLERYHAGEGAFLEMCRCQRAVLEGYEGDDAAGEPALAALRKAAWFAALAPTGPDQRSLLALTAADARLQERLPVHAALLAKLLSKEVVWWRALEAELADEMAAAADVFGGAAGPARREALRARVVEHNLSVVAGYYSRVTLARLAQMLDLPPAAAEAALAGMVTGAGLEAKVDRPAGVVRFGAPAAPGAALNGWAATVGRLLELVDKACQGISRESMVHKVPFAV
jgi:26S proteasome regulatory subunit N5